MTPKNSNLKQVIKTADVVEEIRKMNNTMWTPELEKEFSRDVIKYVVEARDSRGLLYVGLKYNLSPDSIFVKLQEIRAHALVALDAQWAAFKVGRDPRTVKVSGLPLSEQAVQLVP